MAAPEVGVVVELSHGRHPDAGPHVDQGCGQQRRANDLEDVVGGLMGADIDQVEGIELRPAEQVAWSDEVDLVGGARLDVDRRGIGHALRHVARRTPAWAGDTGPGQHPFDGARRWDGLHSQAAELPGDGQGPVLGSGVGHQALSGSEDLVAELTRDPGGRRRRPRAVLAPGIGLTVLAVTGDPLADPPGGAVQRLGDLLGTLTSQSAPDSLAAQFFFGQHDLLAR